MDHMKNIPCSQRVFSVASCMYVRTAIAIIIIAKPAIEVNKN